MGSGNDSILDMYLYETNTLLEQLDGILLAAEQADTFSQDSVNEIFRIMHTIKGSSAMMEFPSLMTVAHRIEDLFFIILSNAEKDIAFSEALSLLHQGGGAVAVNRAIAVAVIYHNFRTVSLIRVHYLNDPGSGSHYINP